ncbi:MAG: hypothetical protein HRT88_11480 [Lentisphaeraceae bacterium]|nr:hypothetical protein [Lentisphaeraceae bacterium]
MHIQKIILIHLITFLSVLSAQNYSIIPIPNKLIKNTGAFSINENTTLHFPESVKNITNLLIDDIEKIKGIKLKTAEQTAPDRR